MNEILVGTGNPAKVQMVRSALAPLGIRVKGTKSIGLSLDIVEDGKTAQENARKKSTAYAKVAKQLVLSTDNALYLDGLTDEEQPGIDTRKVDAHDGRATDEELLAHYCKVIDRLGGETSGRWEFALCIADGKGNVFEKTIVSPRRFVATPSKQMIPGYPLQSIQIDYSADIIRIDYIRPNSGKYMSEMTPEEQDRFWQQMIGKELSDFVSEVLERS